MSLDEKVKLSFLQRFRSSIASKVATLFAAGYLAAAGCEKEEVPHIPPPAKKAEATQVLAGYDVYGLKSVSNEGDTLIFRADSEYAQNLQSGNIIVTGVSEVAPNGLLRKVVSIESTDSEIIVGTEQATLEEAVEQGRVTGHISFYEDYLQDVQPLREGVTSSPLTSNALEINFDNTNLYQNLIFLDGNMRVDFGTDLDIDIGMFKVKHISYSINMEEELNLTLRGEYSQELSEELLSFEPVEFPPLTFAIPTTPPIPVVIKPRLGITFGIEASGELRVESSIIQNIQSEYGLEFVNGNWQKISDFQNSFDFSPPTLSSAEATAEAYVKPKFSLNLYDVAGPYAAVRGFLGAEVNPLEEPWFVVYTGLEVLAGVHLQVIGKLLADHEASIYYLRRNLVTASESCGNDECEEEENEINCPMDCRICVDDGYEPNDSQNTARIMTPGTFSNLRICSDNEDWYKVSVPANQLLELSILFSHSNGDLELELYDSLDSVLDTSNGTDNGEAVEYTPSVSTNLFGRVYGFQEAENGYSMAISLGGCTNECTQEGLRECVDNAWYECGNHDSDNCLEWGSLQSCGSNQHCESGECLNNELPLEGRIVFYSNRDGNNEIYVMNADGTNQRRLTNNPANDRAPAWSPDGQQIAFGRGLEVYVMNADGTNQRNLTNYPAYDKDPTWSPSGTEIAFSSERDGNEEIYVMNADGTTQRNLTNNPDYDGMPNWSPDGTRIAFTSYRDGKWEIYVMNADGTNQRNLTNNSADDLSSDWSPDGRRIAFVSSGYGEIYVMNADGTNQRNLTNYPAYDGMPNWSPNGTEIAFYSQRDGNDEIYVMNADGTNQRNLTNYPADDWGPDWGP